MKKSFWNKGKATIAAFVLCGLLASQIVFAAWPSSSARTKTWGAEVLTAADLHGQFDLIHTYINAMMNASTGHAHTGATSQGPKLSIASALTIASQAQGDVIYASSATVWARLGAGTAGQFLRTGGAAANPTWSNIPAAPRASFSKLVSTYSNATTVTVTADDLVLYDTNNAGVTVNTVSESIAITTAGASGLVVSLSEAANTIYYIWIARKSSDGTVNGYLSTTTSYATFLTQVDSGYDQVALVGCVGNNNSSNFIAYHQNGRIYTFDTWALMAGGTPGVGSWTSIDMTPANMSTNAGFVPSALSSHCFGSWSIGPMANMGMTNDSGASVSLTTQTPGRLLMNNGNGAQLMSFPWEFDTITSETLYYINDTATSNVYLHGFTMNKIS